MSLPQGVSIGWMNGKMAFRSRIKINGKRASLGTYFTMDKAGVIVATAQKMLNAGLVVNKDTVRAQLIKDGHSDRYSK